MKINKVIILLLIGCLASTMLVGCSKESNDNEANSKIENALKNTFGDRGKVKEDTSKDKVTKEEKREDSSKEVKQNTKDDTKDSNKQIENEKDEVIGECCWCGRDISPYENYNYTEDNQLICSNCYPNYCEWLDENYDDCDDSGEYEEEYHDDKCYYCSDCGSRAYYDDDCYPYCWDCYCRHQEEYEVEEYEDTIDDSEDIIG